MIRTLTGPPGQESAAALCCQVLSVPRALHLGPYAVGRSQGSVGSTPSGLQSRSSPSLNLSLGFSV